MSKEFKLVFEPEMKAGDVICPFDDHGSENHYFCMGENIFVHLSKEEREEHNFDIGGKYALLSFNLEDYEDTLKTRGTTTLIKVL